MPRIFQTSSISRMAISPETSLSLRLPSTPMWIDGHLAHRRVRIADSHEQAAARFHWRPSSSDGQVPFLRQTQILAHLDQDLRLAELALQLLDDLVALRRRSSSGIDRQRHPHRMRAVLLVGPVGKATAAENQHHRHHPDHDPSLHHRALIRHPPAHPSRNFMEYPATTATVETLPNGLTLILDPDPDRTRRQRADLGGHRQHARGPHLGAGISHFLEHMVFKGTRDYDADDTRRYRAGRRRPLERLHQLRPHGVLHRRPVRLRCRFS